MATRRHNEPESLGEKLRRRREELGLSIEDIAHEILTTPRFLRALEEDDYKIFSAKVYAQGFLKKLLLTLAVDEPDEYLREFNREWEVRTFHEKPETRALPENRSRTPFFTPRHLGIAASATAGILITGFLGFRLLHFLRAPALLIREPADHIQINTPLVHIEGATEKESHLTVNGREITIGEEGNFNDTLALTAGVNALEFIVTDRFGKTTKEVRYVLVK